MQGVFYSQVVRDIGVPEGLAWQGLVLARCVPHSCHPPWSQCAEPWPGVDWRPVRGSTRGLGRAGPPVSDVLPMPQSAVTAQCSLYITSYHQPRTRYTEHHQDSIPFHWDIIIITIIKSMDGLLLLPLLK